MFPKKNTFAFRLNLKVIPFVVLSAAVIFAAFYFLSRSYMLDSSEENAKNTAEKYVNEIDAVIGSAAKVPYNISFMLDENNLKDEEIISILQEIVSKNKEVYGSTIAFIPFGFKEDRYFYAPYVYKDRESGKIVTTDLNGVDYEYFFKDWYQIPKYLNEPVWSEPYYDEGGGNVLMTTYSAPFYKDVDGEKELWGIITIDIALDWLDSLVSSIKIFDNGFAFVVSHMGTFVTHPNDKYIMNETIFSVAEEENLPKLRETGRRMIKEETGFYRLKDLPTTGDSRIYYAPLNSNHWSLAVVFPESELYADLNNFSIIIIIIGFVGLVFIVFSITGVSEKLTRPLNSFASAAGKIGEGNFNVDLPEIETKDEIGRLHYSFKSMQRELNNYIENLKETTAAKEKMESELRIAHKIQMDMIPKIFPPFPERDDVDLFAFLDSAREVGGDLYDFFFIEDNKLVVLVGDVAGKGVPASLFMAVTRTLIRSQMDKVVSTAKVVDQINRDLMQDNDSKLFVTLLLCIIDLETRTIEYTNGGHNPPYIISKDGTIVPLKDRHGMALGLYELKPYGSSIYHMKEGDKFVLYTDGVNEAMNVKEDLYDYARLENVLVKINNLSAKEGTELILKDIKDFTGNAEQSDDITLLIVSIQ